MTISRRKLMAATIVTLATALAGCGQKGPLFRPEDLEKEKKQSARPDEGQRRKA